MTKIAVAMSGGVDSSVAAALLLEQGNNIFGVTMLVVPENESISYKVPSMAQNVAKKLSIPHFTIDLRQDFRDNIISDFCRQYYSGRTPNPCIWCNPLIKFGLLYKKVQALGASILATGHYAITEKNSGNQRWMLKMGIDLKRDQSYFLHQLSQEQLSKAIFPLGKLTKDEVRLMARALVLPVSDMESREICFIPDHNYRRFLKKQPGIQEKPGDIIDKSGKVLGKHSGLSNYTIGQRHGLGITTSQPIYVFAIDNKNNRIVVGGKSDAFASEFTVSGINWVSICEPEGEITASVKIRYLHPPSPASVRVITGNRARVKFYVPQLAITPGQAAVFYDGTTVIGGGTIEEVKG